MKTAVMYGAGSIGRGFIGALFSKIGYEVVFIDVNDQIVQNINTEKKYPQIIMDEQIQTNWITNIRAVNGKDNESVIREIAAADIMATAVGASVLMKIAPLIAAGLVKRWEENPNNVLDILICENLMDADELLKEELKKVMPERYLAMMEEKLGIVETSIGRMVPPADPSSIAADEHPLAVRVEKYDFLPVDKAAFKGKIPEYEKIIPFEPFHYYLERKLYIHNMAHVTTAYLGKRIGYTYIDEAAKNVAVQKLIVGCMTESASMLSQKYKVNYSELHLHIENLIHRFQNPMLKDTIERVAREPMRKLQPKDRLVGAARACEKEKITPVYLSFAIALALSFFDTDNPVEVLKNTCKIDTNEKLYQMIIHFYDKLSDSNYALEQCIYDIEKYQAEIIGEII